MIFVVIYRYVLRFAEINIFLFIYFIYLLDRIEVRYSTDKPASPPTLLHSYPTYPIIWSDRPKGSGYIGQGPVVQRMHRPRNTLSKGRIIKWTEHPRIFVQKNTGQRQNNIALKPQSNE